MAFLCQASYTSAFSKALMSHGFCIKKSVLKSLNKKNTYFFLKKKSAPCEKKDFVPCVGQDRTERGLSEELTYAGVRCPH